MFGSGQLVSVVSAGVGLGGGGECKHDSRSGQHSQDTRMGPLGVVLSTLLTHFAFVSHILLGMWFTWSLVFLSWVLLCVNCGWEGDISIINLHSR